MYQTMVLVAEEVDDPTIRISLEEAQAIRPGAQVDDIVDNPSDLEIIQVLNTTIPTSLADYDFGLITGSIVWNAREIVDPSSALAQEDILPHLVLQVTVREENADAPWAQAIADAYRSDAFRAYMEEHNTGMWWIPEELR